MDNKLPLETSLQKLKIKKFHEFFEKYCEPTDGGVNVHWSGFPFDVDRELDLEEWIDQAIEEAYELGNCTLTYGVASTTDEYYKIRKKRFTLPRRNKLIKKIKKKYGEAIKLLGKK